MGDSIVDLGAAAADYVGDALSGAYDYLTGTSEASASGGYYKSLGPGARQYYSGPGEDKSSSIMDYIGFEDGGAVDLGAGSPEEMEKFLDFLRKNRPVYKEADERPYTYYSDMLMVPEEKRNTPEQEYETLPRADLYEGFAEPSYGITLEDIEKGTARLSDIQDEAVMGNPYAGTSGNFVPQQYEIVDGSVIANPVGFGGGGVVSLGAGDPGYIDMGDMSMNEGFGLSRDDPAYMQESGFSGPAYAEDQTRPADLLGPFFEEYNPVDGEYKRLERYDMYQDFPEGRRGSDFGRSAPEIAMQDGGSPAVEGIMSVDLSKGADTTGPDTMQPIPQYPGIEGFDIYKDLAPEQFKRRPIDKQMFDKKRGFQFGQMVELRNEAVGGKLLKQAGIMMPVDQVKQTVDPKVMDQMSRILGRQVV